MERLSEDVIKENLSALNGWALTDEKWIVKKYRFRSYLAGISFVNAIANASEAANHHPFISIDYKLITVKLSSWNARGLTALDFKLAEQYDTMYADVENN